MQRAGYLARHGSNEFHIPGLSLGARYPGPPIICDDETLSPPDAPGVYAPSAKPSGRAPHTWLDGGDSP